MRDLLYLTHRIPYPPNKGDKIRTHHVLRYLQRRYRVHLGCFIDDADDLPHAPTVAAGCASSCFIRLHPARARWTSLAALPRGEALSVAYYRSTALRLWVERTLAQQPVSVALACSGPMAQYLPARTARGPLRRVMDLVDVDSEKWRDYADEQPWPLSALYRREAARLLDFERDIARSYDRLMLVSPAEAALFRARAPESAAKTAYFRNGVDSDYFSPQRPYPNPYDGAPVLVFTGAMDYAPNIAATAWFAERVMPALRIRHASLQFHIVGARPVERVRALAGLPGVHVSGTVPDVRPYVHHATLVVAPLRIGRGIQNKVLEAMAMQKVVVASPQALEGIGAVVGEEVLCASRESEFVDHIVARLAPRGQVGPGNRGEEIAAAARRCVLEHYNWENNLERLDEAINLVLDLAPEPEPEPEPLAAAQADAGASLAASRLAHPSATPATLATLATRAPLDPEAAP